MRLGSQLRRRLSVVAVFPLAFAACGDDNGPAIGAVSMNPTQAEISLPLDAFGMSPTEYASFEAARDRLAQQCMQAQGFDFDLINRVASDVTRHNRRYGLIDGEHARTYGYQPAPQDADAERARMALELSIDEVEARALTGVEGGNGSDGGCLGEALRALGAAEIQADISFVDGLGVESWERSKADGRVGQAFDAWSACMASRGFDYRDPIDANNDSEWALPDGQQATALLAGDPQVRAASADVECNRQANVAGVWLAVETAYQEELIDENRERLEGVRSRKEGILRRVGETR